MFAHDDCVERHPQASTELERYLNGIESPLSTVIAFPRAAINRYRSHHIRRVLCDGLLQFLLHIKGCWISRYGKGVAAVAPTMYSCFGFVSMNARKSEAPTIKAIEAKFPVICSRRLA